MVTILLFGMSLVEEVADDFNIPENPASTCVVEEDIDTSSWVIVSFVTNFASSYTIIMARVREHIFLAEGPDTTSDNTSWCSNDMLPWVLKIYIFLT